MKTGKLTWLAIAFGMVVLFAEGGWQRMVAITGVCVVLLVGAVVWVAEKVSSGQSK